MIQIRRIELREIRLDLREPFRISSGCVSERRILLVRVWDADGVSGWGECVAGERPNYSYETLETCRMAILQWAAPRMMKATFADPSEISGVLEQDFRGHHMAKAAVEMACWELEARRRGISLAQLLGAEREAIEVGISIGIQPSPERLAQKVVKATDEGYRKIKIKIGPGRDLEYLKAARQAAGPDAPLMADANNAYTLDDLPQLRKLDEFGLIMIEQPLSHDDLLRHARLQKELETPICLDESITGLERAQDMIELGAGRIINIKPGRVAGFRASRAIHDLCRSHSIPVWCGGMLESGIGRAHNVALAALPNFLIPGDISPSSRYWEKDIVAPEWTMDRGLVKVPLDRPGMGVEVDLDHLERVTVDSVVAGD